MKPRSSLFASVPFSALALLVVVAVFGGCSKDKAPVEPTAGAPTSGHSLRGTVQDTMGTPVAGATVTLTSSEPGAVVSLGASVVRRARPSRTAGSSRSVLTDSHGAFTFDGVSNGTYFVSALASNHLADSKEVVVGSDAVVVLLRLRQTGSFHGKVTLDAASDHHGTVVYVEGTASVALTDADGAYHLLDVPLGDWTVTASHAGYLDQSQPGSLTTEGQDVTLSDVVLARDLNLPPTASIGIDIACADNPSTLAASAHDDDGTIVRYEWDFEDDGDVDTSGATLDAVSHPYPAGSHRAKLIVTDDHGGRGVAARSFAIPAPDTLYVSASTGSDGNPGTRSQPFATLQRALGVPLGPCPSVTVVATGTYAEPFTIPSNRVLLGGRDPLTWQHASGARSRIWTGASPAKGVGAHDTEISDFDFTMGQPIGISANAILVTLDGCPASLHFDRCRFVAGDGGAGSSGANGSPGNRGINGANAVGETPGSLPYGPHFSDKDGGDGGYGASISVSATPGKAGPNSCGPGGAGGAASASVCQATPTNGQDGVFGADSPDGALGTPNTSNGSFSGLAWVPASGTGGTGSCKGGGGGGGGGGGSTCTQHGGAGGSGAGGASGATGGGAGRGGGASIGVLLRDSSPVFEECEFVGGTGGAGGNGGNGATGALGGIGGNPSTIASTGGKGGRGGSSGSSSAGQGGSGGPSWCVVKLGSANPTMNAPTFTTGTGGLGGAGGVGFGGQAAAGPNGPAAVYGP